MRPAQRIASHEHIDKIAIALSPKTVAEFYAEYLEALASLGITPRIYSRPVEIADEVWG